MKTIEATLSVSRLKKLFERVQKSEKKKGKLVGFIGGIPVYANTKVPDGELWIKSEHEFMKVHISDL